MSDSRRTAPSPSYNPLMITELAGYNDSTKGYVEPARHAFELGQKCLKTLWDGMHAVAENTAWSSDRKLIELAASARKLHERAFRAFSSATDNLNKMVVHLEGDLSKPLELGVSNSTLAGEIRTYARTLSVSARQELLTTAISENDSKTVHALLGAPGYLSGLQPEMQAHFTRQYHEHTKPDEVARLALIQKALEHLNRYGPLIEDEVEMVLHQLEDVNTGSHKGVWARIDAIETRYSAARVALDKIP